MKTKTENNTFRAKISKEEINNLPLGKFEGEMHLIDNLESLYQIIDQLKSHEILGFDTETRPSFRKGGNNQISLLQLSTSKEAYLFRLHKTGLPKPLVDILEDPEIIKAGVAINDDIKGLKKIAPFEPESFIELQHYVKLFGIEDISLKKMAAIVMQIRVSKSQRLTNWENEFLSEKQQIYAATDAWVCHQVYQQLNK